MAEVDATDTKKIKSETTGGSPSTAAAVDGTNDPMPVTSSSSSSNFEEPNNKSGLSGFIAFLFSPIGILIMFLAINYPWIKTLLMGKTNDATIPSPTQSPTILPPPVTTTGNERKSRFSTGSWGSRIGGRHDSASSTSSSSSTTTTTTTGTFFNSTTTLELSEPCKNPFRRVFHHECRQEIKHLRNEKRRLRIMEQQAKREEKRRRQQERKLRRQQEKRQKNQGFANATVVTNEILHNGPPLKIANMDTLECNNILSRECRKKKRLMQQMKEALN